MSWFLDGLVFFLKTFAFLCVLSVAGAIGIWLWSLLAIDRIEEDDE